MSNDCFALFGRMPGAILAPATVGDAQEAIRQAQGRAVIPWGGGTRQEIGYAPDRYDLALSTENLTAIVDYQPADMTVTAQAGVTLAQLQAVLAEHRQWLPLEAALPELQTVGGLVATRADSLTRFGCGSVRDSLIGVSVVNSQGELVKGGGRVVKNVAGYDLPKLYCGSWGTLGLITDATFKVAPLPETSATVVLPLNAEHNSEDVLDGLLDSELQPVFVTLLSPAAAQEVLEGGPNAQFLFIGFDGASEDVQWQNETLGVSDGVLTGPMSSAVRARLRDYPLRLAPMTCAFHILSSQVGAYVRMVEWTARRSGFSAHVLADAALGLVWAHFAPAREDADWILFYGDLKDKADRVGGSFIIERMPEDLRAQDVPVWSPLLTDFPLMQRLKSALDPQRMWNPGRFVGRL
jgi:glycolate oxidase FAD binding subunit